MSLLDKFVELFDKDHPQFVAFPVDPTHIDTKPDPVAITEGQTYFRLRLCQMFLKKEVWAAKTWYPTVHSLVKFDFGNQQSVEVPNLVDPSIAGVSDGQGNVITSNLVLTPAVPFSGGTMAVNAGLVAIAGANHLTDFVGVFGKFADLLAVPQLSSVIKIATPLATGIQSLFSAGNSQMHLGFKGAFAAGELKRGHMVVVRATEAQVDPSRMWVVKDQLREGKDAPGSTPFNRFDYMLLRFDIFSDRDDWDKLTYIDEPFQQALDALQDGSEESTKKADFFFQTALRRVFKSPDLTKADQIRVIQALKDRYKQAKSAMGTQGLIATDLSLTTIMAKAIRPEAAVKQPEPSEDDLFELD
jgi:hypothetical protein